MRQRSFILPLAFVAIVSWTSSSWAQFGVAVTPAAHYFFYQEYTATGAVSNTESGIIPGIRAVAALSQGPWHIQWQNSYFKAEVDYDGETLLGVPHRTRTDETMGQSELRLGYTFFRAGNPDSMVSISHGYCWWERDILPNAGVAGLYEYYYWRKTGLALEQVLVHSPADTVWLGLKLFRVYDVAMDVNLLGSDLTLRPQSSNGFKSWLSWNKTLYGYPVDISVYYETWRFGRSAAVGPSGIYEPDSTTHQAGIQLSISNK